MDRIPFSRPPTPARVVRMLLQDAVRAAVAATTVRRPRRGAEGGR